MNKSRGKRMLIGTGESSGRGYGIVRQQPYESQMTLTLNEFILPFLQGDYFKVRNSIRCLYKPIMYSLNKFRSVTAVRITLNSMDIIQTALGTVNEIETLKAQVTSLMADLEQCAHGGRVVQSLHIETGLSANAVIDRIYFDYIKCYGIPKNGVFDTWLLSTLYDYQEQVDYDKSFAETGKPATDLTVPLI